jgi:hypothetical protein
MRLSHRLSLIVKPPTELQKLEGIGFCELAEEQEAQHHHLMAILVGGWLLQYDSIELPLLPYTYIGHIIHATFRKLHSHPVLHFLFLLLHPHRLVPISLFWAEKVAVYMPLAGDRSPLSSPGVRNGILY